MDLEALESKPLVELRVINEAIETELRKLSKEPVNVELLEEKEGEWLFVQMKIYQKEFDNYMAQYQIIPYETACNLGDTTILSSMPNNGDEVEKYKSYMQQIVQCASYINQLKRMYKKIPSGIDFYILQNEHDLGNYLAAGIVVTGVVEENTYDFIENCENGFDDWDKTSLEELMRYKYFEW